MKNSSIISLRKRYLFLTLLTDEELKIIIETAPKYMKSEHFRYVFNKELAARQKQLEEKKEKNPGKA